LETRGMFGIQHLILPETRKEFLKTHNIGLTPGKLGRMVHLCKCHSIMVIINNMRVSTCTSTCGSGMYVVQKYKNTNLQQMHKESVTINRTTLLHVSTLLGHLQG
jgi:hypothetical protein